MKRLVAVIGCLVLFSAAEIGAATVSGNVRFVTKRGQRPVLDQTVVWLEPVTGRPAPKAPVTAQILTRSKTLFPHVLTVPVGSTVEFPNDDPISHNLFSLAPGNSFDLGLYRKGAGKSRRFDTPGVVNVYCNVHPNMSAVIHVMPTAHYAFAGTDGSYTIDVPPGRYRMVAWNELGGTTETVVDVPDAGVAGMALTIDSRKFRAVQHMNKAGRPYRSSGREY